VGTQKKSEKKLKKNAEKIWKLSKKGLPLQRYPENNLFTLKD